MKVFIAQPIPENAAKILKEGGLEVEENKENKVLSKSELIEKLQDKDISLSLLTDKIDQEVFDGCPNLKMVSNYAVGYNNIDIKAATAKNIPVGNTPGVLTDATADMAFALLIGAARLLLPADKFTREGKFTKWEPLAFLGQELKGKTLGIIGAGRIGSAMAQRGHFGFDMEILYTNRSENEKLNNEMNAKQVSLEKLLEKSDFVSIHVPLTEETKHLIGEKELQTMKKSAILINTARGPIVDEGALANALKNGEIFSAGLDVYEEEPTIHPTLLKLDNVILAPHIASATIHTREEMARLAAENIVAFTKGEKAPSIVNLEDLQ